MLTEELRKTGSNRDQPLCAYVWLRFHAHILQQHSGQIIRLSLFATI